MGFLVGCQESSALFPEELRERSLSFPLPIETNGIWWSQIPAVGEKSWKVNKDSIKTNKGLLQLFFLSFSAPPISLLPLH